VIYELLFSIAFFLIFRLKYRTIKTTGKEMVNNISYGDYDCDESGMLDLSSLQDCLDQPPTMERKLSRIAQDILSAQEKTERREFKDVSKLQSIGLFPDPIMNKSNEALRSFVLQHDNELCRLVNAGIDRDDIIALASKDFSFFKQIVERCDAIIDLKKVNISFKYITGAKEPLRGQFLAYGTGLARLIRAGVPPEDIFSLEQTLRTSVIKHSYILASLVEMGVSFKSLIADKFIVNKYCYGISILIEAFLALKEPQRAAFLSLKVPQPMNAQTFFNMLVNEEKGFKTLIFTHPSDMSALMEIGMTLPTIKNIKPPARQIQILESSFEISHLVNAGVPLDQILALDDVLLTQVLKHALDIVEFINADGFFESLIADPSLIKKISNDSCQSPDLEKAGLSRESIKTFQTRKGMSSRTSNIFALIKNKENQPSEAQAVPPPQKASAIRIEKAPLKPPLPPGKPKQTSRHLKAQTISSLPKAAKILSQKEYLKPPPLSRKSRRH
jgi:hypothetical protein